MRSLVKKRLMKLRSFLKIASIKFKRKVKSSRNKRRKEKRMIEKIQKKMKANQI